MVMSIIAATFSTVPLSLSAAALPWDLNGYGLFENYENQVPNYLYKMSNVGLVLSKQELLLLSSGPTRTECYIYFQFEVDK